MKYLFLHQSFPGQFYEVLQALGKDKNNEVIFLYEHRYLSDISGVKAIPFHLEPSSHAAHPYVDSLQKAIAQGIAVYRAAAVLKEQGFYPQVIIGHSGWGANMYMKDLFPKARLIAYCEWFFHARNSEIDFDPSRPVSDELLCLTRTANAAFLLDLSSCDAALSPTQWQAKQIPAEYRYKQAVIHDGIDTALHQPSLGSKLVLPQRSLNLSGCQEIVTYVTRGKDLYRGFPQFMETVALLLKKRPNCQVVIVGGDQTAYGPPPVGYSSYKEMMLDKLQTDWQRIHFTGPLPKNEYRMVLQASSVHVYLTYPFVLSWSLLEAMSCGCLVLASSTSPVKEVIQDGVNGFLADFFSPGELAEKIGIMLERQTELVVVRQRARQTILDLYDRKRTVPMQLQFFQDVWEKRFPFAK